MNVHILCIQPIEVIIVIGLTGVAGLIKRFIKTVFGTS